MGSHPGRSPFPRSFGGCLAVAPAILAWALVMPGLARASWETAPSAFVVLRADAPGPIRDFVERLEAEGGHAAVVYPPSAAVIFADDAVLNGPAMRAWLGEVARGKIADTTLRGMGREARVAAGAWNQALELPVAAAVVPKGFAPTPDVGPLPAGAIAARQEQATATSSRLPYGGQYFDTSEFFAGSVAVGVWLLDASDTTYRWTAAEESQTLGGIQGALAIWASKGGPAARLTFYLETHTHVPVSGVPIHQPMTQDVTWMNEALGNLGWPGANGFERCFAYNNAIRDTFDTNWCYSIVVVDCVPTENEGLFSGGGYAWAYYGGPWVYMSRFSSWAYNSANYFLVVPMHESGHIFMATDEYDGKQQYSGYLRESDNPSTSVVCIMNENDFPVCTQSRYQLGWRDLNVNGIIDPIDSPPLLMLNPTAPDPTDEPTPSWTGSAQVTTVPNLNPFSRYYPPHPMTIATIDSVQVRLDGGAWVPALPADGAFDGYTENFSWAAPPLTYGVHVLEARARNSFGAWSAIAADTVEFVENPLRLFAAETPYEVGEHLRALAIGDFDGDLDPDLAVANQDSSAVTVLRGRGDGTFGPGTNYPVGSIPSAVAVGDLNRDRRLDLLVANWGSGTVSVLLGNGDGSFAPKTDFATGLSPSAVAIADLNGDGHLDLAVSNRDAASVSVLLGNGDGSFAPKTDFATGLEPYSLAIGDLDGDGHADLAVASFHSSEVSVLLGNGDGSFRARTDFPTDLHPRSVAIGDLDGDGWPDLALACQDSSTISVLRGNGDGTFAARTDFATGDSPRWVSIGDVDHDGRLDLVSANFLAYTVSVLLGNGDGTFGSGTEFAVGTNPLCVAIGDLDRDGRLDLAVANYYSSVSVLLNRGRGLVAVEEGLAPPAQRLELSSPAPSPSRGRTEIRLRLPAAGSITAEVLDIAGRRLRTLADHRALPAGDHLLRWDGLDTDGRPVTSGVYFVLVRSDRETAVRRVVVAR